MHMIHVPVKILKLGGLNTSWSTTPHPPQRKRLPRIAHWEGTDINKVALKFTGSWGSWGSEVPKLTSTPCLPGELNLLLDRLTPLVACSKVGTFGERPMDE